MMEKMKPSNFFITWWRNEARRLLWTLSLLPNKLLGFIMSCWQRKSGRVHNGVRFGLTRGGPVQKSGYVPACISVAALCYPLPAERVRRTLKFLHKKMGEGNLQHPTLPSLFPKSKIHAEPLFGFADLFITAGGHVGNKFIRVFEEYIGT